MIKIIIAIVALSALIFGGVAFAATHQTTGNTVLVDEENRFSFTVEGEVSKPGTYVLEEVTTMGQLIEAAGGISSNADELAFFEDVTLVSGTTYYIAGKYDASDICSNAPIDKVNINSDTADELMSVNGISSSIASAIVSYRVENGTFRTLEDLLNVYGIGNATYRKIRGYVILHN